MPTPKQTHNPTAFGSAAQVNTSHCIPISTNPQAFIYSDTKSHTVCNAYHQHATSHTDTLIIYCNILDMPVCDRLQLRAKHNYTLLAKHVS